MHVAVLSQTTGIATETEQVRLKLASGAKVARVARVRSGDGQTFSYELAVVSLDRLPMTNGDVSADLATGAREHGLVLGTANESVRTVSADETIAAHLGVGVGEDVQRWDRIVHCADELPVEWRLAFTTHDRFATIPAGD